VKTVKRRLWGTTIRVEPDDPAQVFVGYWYKMRSRRLVQIPFPLPCVVVRVDEEKGFVYCRDRDGNSHLLAKADFVFRRVRKPKTMRRI
jgi:hypothetical protein